MFFLNYINIKFTSLYIYIYRFLRLKLEALSLYISNIRTLYTFIYF